MIVNFRVCGISRGTRKLTQTSILIKNKNKNCQPSVIKRRPLLKFRNQKRSKTELIKSKKAEVETVEVEKELKFFDWLKCIVELFILKYDQKNIMSSYYFKKFNIMTITILFFKNNIQYIIISVLNIILVLLKFRNQSVICPSFYVYYCTLERYDGMKESLLICFYILKKFKIIYFILF